MDLNQEEKMDIAVDSLEIMSAEVCSILAKAKEKQDNAVSVIYVDADGNDQAITVYDWYEHTWTSSDSFDRLAAELLGSAEYATVLAFFNGVAIESRLEAGTKIKIPELERRAANYSNRIYAEPDRQDNYGIDIMISEDDGDLAVGSDGDLATISGKANLSQAVICRLTTAAQRRIRLTAYGIRKSVGDNRAVEGYLITSISQTLLSDPRVRSIDNIAYRGSGDVLKLDIIYTDINGETLSIREDI